MSPRTRGFTLIEMMVTVAILAVLMAVASPSFSNLRLTSSLANIANSLVASARLARTSAIARNTTVTMCPSSTGTSCSSLGGWEQGWVVLAGTTVLGKEPAITPGFKVNTTATTLGFDATGAGATQATFTVCRNSPTVGSEERVVELTATGKTTVRKSKTGLCPG